MKKPIKAVPLGKPLDTPDDELDMLALVTPEDVELAKADALAKMTPRGRALLEAAKAATEDNEPL